MAVQAQHLSSGDQRNRTTQPPGFDLSTIDPRSLLAPIPFHGALLGECPTQQSVFMGGAPAAMESMQRLSQHGLVLPNFPLYQAPLPTSMPEMDVTMGGGSRKRRKESTDRHSVHLHQGHLHNKQQLQLGVDLNQTLGCSPASGIPHVGVHNVSTGLRLAFDDERSTVTSSRLDSYSSTSLALKDELSAQLSQHQDELNQLIRAQAEQMRQTLEDRTQRQSKALLAAVEGGLSKRLREKEAEMESLSRRNMELEDTVKQLGMESQMWQSKAKNNEAMVAILRTNLQQAMLVQHQSREQQSRLEGCGDSEVDDAASIYIDDNPHAQQSRAMAGMKKAPHNTGRLSSAAGLLMTTPQSSNMNNEIANMRACRRCKVKEASVVLLPCLHLCLCVLCKDECDRCPVCNSLRSAGVEVYLS